MFHLHQKLHFEDKTDIAFEMTVFHLGQNNIVGNASVFLELLACICTYACHMSVQAKYL